MVRQSAPNRLLVEGKDDVHSVIHLLERHGVDWDNPVRELPYIHDSGGVEPLIDSISAAAKSFRRLGILVDADIDLMGRWERIRFQLRSADVEIPETPVRAGTIIESQNLQARIGIWLMPDNSQPGMLEDFLATLIPPGDVLWPYANQVVADVRSNGARFPEVATPKARIHTWLAWQEEPGRPFGTALTAAYFATDTPSARAFVAWFKNLFIN